MRNSLGQIAKAIYAAAVAGLSGLSAVLVGGDSLGQVTSGQWVSIALAALVAGGGVYGITNAKPASP
jgi:hypothetical protein